MKNMKNMKDMVNRLHFTANLRERDLESLIASLSRLRQAETLAEKHGIVIERELEDYERIVTLLVPTEKIANVASELTILSISAGTLDVYDPEALSVAEGLGFVVEDMTSEGYFSNSD